MKTRIFVVLGVVLGFFGTLGILFMLMVIPSLDDPQVEVAAAEEAPADPAVVPEIVPYGAVAGVDGSWHMPEQAPVEKPAAAVASDELELTIAAPAEHVVERPVTMLPLNMELQVQAAGISGTITWVTLKVPGGLPAVNGQDPSVQAGWVQDVITSGLKFRWQTEEPWTNGQGSGLAENPWFAVSLACQLPPQHGWAVWLWFDRWVPISGTSEWQPLADGWLWLAEQCLNMQAKLPVYTNPGDTSPSWYTTPRSAGGMEEANDAVKRVMVGIPEGLPGGTQLVCLYQNDTEPLGGKTCLYYLGPEGQASQVIPVAPVAPAVVQATPTVPASDSVELPKPAIWSQVTSVRIIGPLNLHLEGERWIETPTGSGNWTFSHLVEIDLTAAEGEVKEVNLSGDQNDVVKFASATGAGKAILFADANFQGASFEVLGQ